MNVACPLFSAAIYCALFALLPLSAPGQDSDPPQLVDVHILTPTVDITNGAGLLRAEFDITDDYSGLSAAVTRVNFGTTTFRTGFGGGSIVEGTPFDGTYAFEFTVPAGSAPGERSLDLFLWDNEGRTNYLFDISTFEVINNGPYDQEKPKIHAITVEPKVLDLTNGPQTVNMSIELSDDYSGIASIHIGVAPTDPESAVIDTRSARRYDLTNGPERITLDYSFVMGAYTPEGEWQFTMENLADHTLRASTYNEDPEKLRTDYDPSFEIINPNGDSTPPELISVEFLETVANTANDVSFLPWQVQFADEPAGVDLISVYVYAPGGADNYIYSGKIYDQLNEVNINGDTLTGILEVPQYIEEGEHRVQVLMRDVANNRITYGHLGDEPLPPGSTEFITVEESAGIDTQPIVVEDFSITPGSVDITDGPQLVTFEVDFTEDRSGLSRISLGVEDSNGDRIESARLNTDDLLTGTPMAGTLLSSFEIPRYSPPGEYRFSSLVTRDQAGNLFTDSSYPVFPVSMPSAFTVVNNGPVETEPPEILSFEFPRTTIEIVEDRQRFPVIMRAQDDYSGIRWGWVEYALEGNPEEEILFILSAPGDIIKEEGLVKTFEDGGVLRNYVVPGTYKLSDLWIQDNYGLKREYDLGDSSGLPPGLPGELTIINPFPADTGPPEFTDIRLSTTEIDVSQYPGSLTVEIDFTEDTSGLEEAFIDLYNSDEFYRVDLLSTYSASQDLNIVSGDKNQGTLKYIFEIPRYIPPGSYEVQYELQDAAFKDTDIEGNDDDFPFPGSGTVTITNSGPVDFSDPLLRDLEVPETVDVSNGPVFLNISAEAIDNLAGVSSIYLYTESPSGGDWTNDRIEPVSEDGSPVLEGRFPMTLEIPAFAEPGEWSLEMTLQDRNNGYKNYEPVDLKRWGFPSSFTVVNTRPPGYLWKESDEVTADGWREVDWFGWVQDQGDYPFVYHLEHGWIYTSGSRLAQFAFYELTLGIWWWIDEENYPWMYLQGGSGKSGWVYYYAPFGSPGNRWFYDPATGEPVLETQLFGN